jgi:hypothetical protein
VNELAKCSECGHLTPDCDNDGNPLCESCRVDREARKIDQTYDEWRDRWAGC